MNMPNILLETSGGYSSCRIQDNLMQQRAVLCFGEITPEQADSLILQMLYLSAQSEQEITMYIHSPGGEVNSGFAIYDAMRLVNCPIRTVCVGSASSMAALLFAAGDTRCILPHGEVMIHDPLVRQISGSTIKIKDCADSLLQIRTAMAEILAQSTGRTAEEILEKTERETTFTAAEAVEFGLAHQILNSFSDLPRPRIPE